MSKEANELTLPKWILTCDIYGCNNRADYVIEDNVGGGIFRCSKHFKTKYDEWIRLAQEGRVRIYRIY